MAKLTCCAACRRNRVTPIAALKIPNTGSTASLCNLALAYPALVNTVAGRHPSLGWFRRSSPIRRGGDEVGGQDQVRAVGADNRLRVVIGRLGPTSPPSLLCVVGGLVGFMSRPRCRRLLAGVGAQPRAGRIKLGLRGLTPGDFGWQRLWIDIDSIGDPAWSVSIALPAQCDATRKCHWHSC